MSENGKKEDRIIDRITSLKILEKKGPFRQFFNSQELTSENLTDEQRRLAQSFKEGIAQAIGVPSDHIQEEPIQRWIINFTRAFVKPEFIKETIAPTTRLMKLRGQELGVIIREGIEKIEAEKTETVIPPSNPVVDQQQPNQQPQRSRQSITPIDH